MKKTILVLLLLVGWNAQAHVPVGGLDLAIGLPVLAMEGFVVCGTDCNGDRVAKRDGNYGFLAREGMAFSRVLTSPLNVILPYFGVCYAYRDEESTFEYFTAMPGMLAVYAFYGAASTVDEVCVGTFEILTSMQVKQVYYPWESYSASYDRIQKSIRDGRAHKAAEAQKLKDRKEEAERKRCEIEQRRKDLELQRDSIMKRQTRQGDDLGALMKDLEVMNYQTNGNDK